MVTNRLDQLFAAFLIGFGGYIVWTGLDYGYMRGTTPGPGYFPVLIGIAIIVLSIVNLLRSLAGAENLKDTMARIDIIKTVTLTAALVGVVVLTPLVGLMLAVSLFMFAAAFVIRPSLERKFLVRLIPTCILVPIILNYMFTTFLRIPIPTGMFGI